MKLHATLILVVSLQRALIAESNEWPKINTFHIRHHYGKCLEFSATLNSLVFAKICREKFRWSSGKLVHLRTKKCVVVNSTDEASLVGLTSQCSKTNTLFQYEEESNTLRHLISGKCLYPRNGIDDPASGTGLVIKEGCNDNKSKYYFRSYVYYTIWHYSHLCFYYDDLLFRFVLKRVQICDRFYYDEDLNIRHVKTGKCMSASTIHPKHLQLTSYCGRSNFTQNSYSNIQLLPTECIHPYSGILFPPDGDNLVLWDDYACGDSDRIRFYFHDDKGIEENTFFVIFNAKIDR